MLVLLRERLDDLRVMVEDYDAGIDWVDGPKRREKLERVARCRELIQDLEALVVRRPEPEVIRFNVPKELRR